VRYSNAAMDCGNPKLSSTMLQQIIHSETIYVEMNLIMSK
jgi:hypothetical protein